MLNAVESCGKRGRDGHVRDARYEVVQLLDGRPCFLVLREHALPCESVDGKVSFKLVLVAVDVVEAYEDAKLSLKNTECTASCILGIKCCPAVIGNVDAAPLRIPERVSVEGGRSIGPQRRPSWGDKVEQKVHLWVLRDRLVNSPGAIDEGGLLCSGQMVSPVSIAFGSDRQIRKRLPLKVDGKVGKMLDRGEGARKVLLEGTKHVDLVVDRLLAQQGKCDAVGRR